ncbi:alpha/beta-hydrolases superfamily protein [Klebsormidium nitens]|uniref:Alpha/beta-hydrolases superfamily protein n=1 Tax=Klebsormidium nitens TaxID=105231 RepID=A0A1Y1HSU4_KLENI|nr:alpha/beta-hydrolases superfamily protein [Klebsormidium nitens]|eukprot:GAQ80071.1 alpha/beta-hydrolases superfamily protein [Klebsormidium nitens]
MACFGCRCGFSLVGVQKWRLTRTFQRCGLIERQVQIDDQTSIHCWVSKPFAKHQELQKIPRRKSLLLLHGFGASAIFQWAGQINAFHKQFDLIIPDLIFFGGSTSSSEERSEIFEAASMARLMHDIFKVERYHVAGISYGGFVAYRMAYNYPERVQRVVLTDSPGVVMVRSDYERMLSTHGVASTADLLLPETPADVRRLLQVAYYRPPWVPNFLLRDTLQVMFSEMVEEKRGMLVKLLEYLDKPEVPLPKLTQDVLIVWGEQDEIFPLSLAQRLQEFLGKKARLVVLKEARHASNIEKPREYNRAVLEFLLREGA